MAYRIKRYSNRKLYDVQQRRYVTLEELEEMIREGTELSVVDARSGKDLTAVTMAQIILEIERQGRPAPPAAFLQGLIKHGEAWQEFLRESLRASLEGLMTNQREADRIVRAWASRSGLIPSTGSPPRAGETVPRRRQAGRGTARQSEGLREEISALRDRLRRLERDVKGRRRRRRRG